MTFFITPSAPRFVRCMPLLGVFIGTTAQAQPAAYQALMQDVLVEADIWDNEPKILSASFGFDGILGVQPTEGAVRAAGGTWMDLPADIAATAFIRTVTSAAPPVAMLNAYGVATAAADGLPIVFSWPVMPETVQRPTSRCTSAMAPWFAPGPFRSSRASSSTSGTWWSPWASSAIACPPGAPGSISLLRTVVVYDGTPLTLVRPWRRAPLCRGVGDGQWQPLSSGRGPETCRCETQSDVRLGRGAPPNLRQFPSQRRHGRVRRGRRVSSAGPDLRRVLAQRCDRRATRRVPAVLPPARDRQRFDDRADRDRR